MNIGELPVITSILLPLFGAVLLPAISSGTNHGTTRLMRISMFLITATVIFVSMFYLVHARCYNAQQHHLVLQMGRLSQFGNIFVMTTATMTLLQLWDHLHQEGWVTAKPLSSLLLSISGMMLLSATNNIFIIFLAITIIFTQLRTLTTPVDMRIDSKPCINHCF